MLTPYDRRRKQIEDQFPLLRDSQVSISPRTYYFDRQRETGDDSVAWALGGSIDYQSGWWRETVFHPDCFNLSCLTRLNV